MMEDARKKYDDELDQINSDCEDDYGRKSSDDKKNYGWSKWDKDCDDVTDKFNAEMEKCADDLREELSQKFEVEKGEIDKIIKGEGSMYERVYPCSCISPDLPEIKTNEEKCKSDHEEKKKNLSFKKHRNEA